MKEKILCFFKDTKKLKIIVYTILIFVIVMVLLNMIIGSGVTLSCMEAEDVALKKLGNGTVTKCERERNRFEITIMHREYKYEFEIDGKSGEIISYDSDYIKEIPD